VLANERPRGWVPSAHSKLGIEAWASSSRAFAPLTSGTASSLGYAPRLPSQALPRSGRSLIPTLLYRLWVLPTLELSRFLTWVMWGADTV
jgi:hypothetical protein